MSAASPITTQGVNFRPWILSFLAGMVFIQMVALSPTRLEDSGNKIRGTTPEDLILDLEQNEKTLAPQVPRGRIPEYTIDDFDYISAVGGRRNWKLSAQRAFAYNSEKLMHSRQVAAQLYDPDEKVTVVTGKEAKYYTDRRDLEVFGNVEVTLPDGFVIHSQYMRYDPDTRRVLIPNQYPVQGEGTQENGQKIFFTSIGLDFDQAKNHIYLPQQVRFILEQKKQNISSSQVPERTLIESDWATIERNSKKTHFEMRKDRALENRFVRVWQPSMYVQGRKADLNYGDFSKLFDYMVVTEDVMVQERENEQDEATTLRYSTSGRADFDTQKNDIHLTLYPQVYEGGDTVTGESILIHRDTDIVEVVNSNAFTNNPAPPPEAKATPVPRSRAAQKLTPHSEGWFESEGD